MEHISNEMLIAIKEINKQYPDTIFCGSLGLVLNNKLDREVKDIDLLTDDNYYSKSDFFHDLRVANKSQSHKLMLSENEVSCFKIEMPILNKVISIDALGNLSGTEFDIMELDGVDIKVEKPEFAIKAKINYIKADKSNKSVLKHLKDLIYMEVDKNLIIEAIDNSVLSPEVNKNEEISLDFPDFRNFPKFK